MSGIHPLKYLPPKVSKQQVRDSNQWYLKQQKRFIISKFKKNMNKQIKNGGVF